MVVLRILHPDPEGLGAAAVDTVVPTMKIKNGEMKHPK